MNLPAIFSSLLSCVLVCLCVLAISAMEVTSDLKPASARIDNHQQPQTLPAGLVPAVAQTLASHLPTTWQATRSAHAVRFNNPRQHLVLRFDNQGMHLTMQSHSTLSLQLTGYTQGTEALTLKSATLSSHGTRVSLNRGAGLTEWYVNSPFGIEQGFTLAQTFNKATSVNLIFKLQGSLAPSLKNGILVFHNHDGKSVLQYADLLAYDARHKQLPAHLHLAGDNLILAINIHGARYPITVDPLFSLIATIPDPALMNEESFGIAVALSRDGSTALVGTMANSTSGNGLYTGSAYVFTKLNGTWVTTPVASFVNPYPIGGEGFGGSVALSADGTIALIGASGNNAVPGSTITAFRGGQAFIYTETGGTWSTTPAATFNNPFLNNIFGDGFGVSVALSGNGAIALIGAPGPGPAVSNSQAGEAYLYTETNGVWTTTPVATFTDPRASDADTNQFGSYVAISTDGTTTLIGAIGGTEEVNESSIGEAYIYTETNGAWSTNPVATFTDPAASASDSFGVVALSSDSTTALIGAPGTTVSGSSQAGEAYLYTETNGAWPTTPVATFTDPGVTAGDYFGDSVALSSDGTTALVGAEYVPAGGTDINDLTVAGKAYLYTESDGTWNQTPTVTLDDPENSAGDSFGDAVALSDDGSTALIGARGTVLDIIVAGGGQAYMYGNVPSADLSLALTASPTSVTAGNSLSYMLTVTNMDSQVTATNLTLKDQLPTGITYVSDNAAGGSCSEVSGTVTCTLDSVAPQATWQPSITATATTAGSITDTATISASQLDPNMTNNTASVTTNVTSSGGGSGGSGGSGSGGSGSSSGGGGGGGAFDVLSLILLAGFASRRKRR